jgi:2-iminoacetate synthase
MSFYSIYTKYKDLPFDRCFSEISRQDIENAIQREKKDINSLIALLSVPAENCLEEMANKAHSITLSNFGKTIQLYTPIYLSNFCENQCAYCGFNAKNNVNRKKLSYEEVEKEAQCISKTGLEHILVLTGESREKTPPEYIINCIKILKKYFSSISIEIYAMTETEYSEMVKEGVDGLTIYQETYDEGIYSNIHLSGPKKDYLYRLNAPERAERNHIRNVNLGVLLGLSDWRKEVFFLGLHAKYLQDKFYDTEICISVPRLRPHTGNFKVGYNVTDKNIVQIITALRIYMPRLGITLSTRENPKLRENLLPLGITRMSAGSSTIVGGHTLHISDDFNSSQFEISDKRNVEEIKEMLSKKGYQPVLKDWLHI